MFPTPDGASRVEPRGTEPNFRRPDDGAAVARFGRGPFWRRNWLARARAALVAAVVVYLVVCVGEPLRTNWGDRWSDSNVQRSGSVFANDGFIANAFVPHDRPASVAGEAAPVTHHPPLPDLVNRFEQWGLGARDITVYRLFALGMTFAALAFF